MGGRELGIDDDGLLKSFDPSFQPGFRSLAPFIAALQVGAIRIRVCRGLSGDPLSLLVRQRNSQRVWKILQDASLQMNQLDASPGTWRPNLRVASDVNQIDLYSQATILLGDAARHHRRHIQLAACVFRPYGRPLVAKRIRPRGNAQLLQLHKPVDRGLGHTVGEVIVTRAVTRKAARPPSRTRHRFLRLRAPKATAIATHNGYGDERPPRCSDRFE